MGLWGKLVKSVDVWGEGDTTFVALLKKWNEIFKRTEMFAQFQSVNKPKENPTTADEACTTLIAPDFKVKFWQNIYQGLGLESLGGDVWYSHCRKFPCKYSDWDSAFYQVRIEYIANGKTLGLDYITGDYYDGDEIWEKAALRLSLAVDDDSINTSASAEAETEHSDGVYPPDMFKAMEKPNTGERLANFIKNLGSVPYRIESRVRMAEKAKEAEAEHKQKLDDAFGDL